MMPFFSIIIPLYNKGNAVSNTLKTVVNQSYSDYEIIIVNDGSTDHSLQQIAAFKDSRIRIFSIENRGVSHARNFGIQNAVADYIVFLDADDLWYPTHLMELKTLLETYPNCGLYANAYARKKNQRILASTYKNIPKERPWKGIVTDFFDSSTIDAIAWTSAVMVPKKVLNTLGGFDEKTPLETGQDTDLWIRIACRYPVAFNNRVTAIYVLDAENRVSQANINTQRVIDLDRYEGVARSASLKKYLDIHRYALALRYTLADNLERRAHYRKCLNLNHLNARQRFLLRCNRPLLRGFIRVQNLLRTFNLNLTAFK